jgi:Tol biopolymer transport system component
MDDRGHVTIMDTVTRSAIKDLGPGVAPTWSPDGRFIAFQERAERARRSDFVIYATDGPGRPTTLMSNTVPRFFPRRGTYYGPAVWSPDSQYCK